MNEQQEMYTATYVRKLSNLNQRVGFLEGVLLGLEFAVTYEEVRGCLERANRRYDEIKGKSMEKHDG